MSDGVQRYIIVDELFPRYTIFVDIAARTTSVYCDECSQWVLEMDGEQVSRNTHVELMERILENHQKQVLGHPVEIDDVSKDLSDWRE